MRRALGLVAMGLAALIVQGALTLFVPAPWCPDLGFLAVVAVGIALEDADGLLVSATLGYFADLLSGSLLGQHALLRTCAWGATRIANRRLNLMRTLPRFVFVVCLSFANGIALAVLTRMLGAGAPFGLTFLGDLVIHALVTAVCALPVIASIERVATRLSGDDEATRRTLRLEARGPGG